MVRVRQLQQYFVRARRKTLDDDRVSACIHPDPRGIVKAQMKVPDTRRGGRSAGAEHRFEMNVLDAILNDDHSTGGKRIGQGRIGDNFRSGLGACERITWASPHLSVTLCAAALIANSAVAAITTRDVPFKLMHLRFVICSPPLR